MKGNRDATEERRRNVDECRYVSQPVAAAYIASPVRPRSPAKILAPPLRVALGSFDPVFSVGLACVLGEDQGLEVLQRDSSEPFEHFVNNRVPDITLLDAADRDMLARMREAYPATRLLVLAGGLTNANAARHLGLGTGCLSHAARPQEIRDAIRLAMATERPFVWFDGQRLEPRYPSDAPPLTCREQEVLEQLCKGLLNKEIACKMKISIRTVEVHMARIRRKSGAASKRELVRQLTRPR